MLGGNGAARYNTFIAIVRFAEASTKEVFALVEPLCEGLDGKLAEWGTDVAKSRDLCLAISSAMAKHGNKCVYANLVSETKHLLHGLCML